MTDKPEAGSAPPQAGTAPPCARCHGTGVMTWFDEGDVAVTEPCNQCNGSGHATGVSVRGLHGDRVADVLLHGSPTTEVASGAAPAEPLTDQQYAQRLAARLRESAGRVPGALVQQDMRSAASMLEKLAQLAAQQAALRELIEHVESIDRMAQAITKPNGVAQLALGIRQQTARLKIELARLLGEPGE